jgi:hypothetical protein
LRRLSLSVPGRNPSLPPVTRLLPRLLVSLCAAISLTVTGCRLIGRGPGDPSPPSAPSDPLTQPDSAPGNPELVRGVVYQGYIEIDQGKLSAALELVREGRQTVMGVLQTTSGLLAEGEGRLRGSTLRLELLYGGTCPGRMLLEGEWDRDSLTYEGTVEASDCTGGGGGTFRFSAS